MATALINVKIIFDSSQIRNSIKKIQRKLFWFRVVIFWRNLINKIKKFLNL